MVYSLSGRGRDVWVGRRRGGLARVRLEGRHAIVDRFTTADGLAQDSVFSVHHARDGSVWAGTLSAGLSRYRDGTFTTYGVADGLASNTVNTMLEAADGSLWFGTPTGVSIKSPAGWRTIDASHGLPGSDVSALLQDRSGTIWIGTTAGLASSREGRVQRVGDVPLLAGAILGLAEDRAGQLWVATTDQVARVDPAQMRLSAPRLLVRDFGPADGLARGEGVKRHRSVVSDAAGVIWLSLSGGLSQVDSASLERRGMPVTPWVEAIAGDEGVLAVGDVVQVPPRTRRVTLALGGASLSTPERARFRYRLDGFDATWSVPQAARQAEYTNLAPGTYDFRVMASDVEGTWTGPEARLRIRVAPAFWQTTWFHASVVFAVAAAGWGAYRLRLRKVARQLARAFDERLARADSHRAGPARHLAAGVRERRRCSCTWPSTACPDESPARPSLERVQQLMRTVIDEGRNAVRGLRAAPRPARMGSSRRSPHPWRTGASTMRAGSAWWSRAAPRARCIR